MMGPPASSPEESSLSVAHFGVSVRREGGGGLKFQRWDSASTGEGLSTGGGKLEKENKV